MLLRKADGMFPEGQGAPRAFAKEGTPAGKTNELLENATIAIDQLFKRRGYDPKKPEEVQAKLGYALDRYEAAAYIVTGAMHLPLLKGSITEEVPEAAWALEPSMATEHNSTPCPYGFGRVVRWPWSLHLHALGFCDPECRCDVIFRSRAKVVNTSLGLGWQGPWGGYGSDSSDDL